MSAFANSCAAVSLIAGLYFLISTHRSKLPSFCAGVSLVIAGAVILGLPILNELQAIGWLLFSLWIVSLPVALLCAVVLSAWAITSRTTPDAPIIALLASLLNLRPAYEFYVGASLGVV